LKEINVNYRKGRSELVPEGLPQETPAPAPGGSNGALENTDALWGYFIALHKWILCMFVCFSITGVLPQGLALDRQSPHHLSHSSSTAQMFSMLFLK
jgi:hypothetical protein